MRMAIFAVASLILGGIVGVVLARQEFVNEALPIIGTTGAGAAAGSEQEGPRLSLLTPERFEFGDMDQDAVMRHTFEIRNDGDQPLKVTEMGTSCKCTTAGLDKDHLQPGETAIITMEWNAKGSLSLFEQHAEYKTNDPRRPRFRLIVSGTIRDTLMAEPRELAFNRVSSLVPAEAKLKLYGIRGDKLEIVKHQFTKSQTASFFSVQFRPLSAEEIAKSNFKCGVEITVGLEPGMRLGQLDQNLQITTNLNPDATFDIAIYG